MKSKIRPLDEQGRIVIPTEIRKELRIKYGDKFFIKREGKQIIVTKIEEDETCELCKRKPEKLLKVDNFVICEICINTIGELFNKNKV